MTLWSRTILRFRQIAVQLWCRPGLLRGLTLKQLMQAGQPRSIHAGMGHHGAVKQVVGPALGHPHQLAVAIALQAFRRELVGKHLVGILVQGDGLPGIFGQTGEQQALEIMRVQQIEPQPALNAYA